MAIYKNVASQKIAVYAWDSAAQAPKTGNAASITAQISLDGGATAATNDVNPTELDSADAPGIYLFDMTQAETDADLIIVAPVSATADIDLEPVIIYTLPATGPLATASALQTVDDEIATIDGNVDLVLADTNELETDWTDGGRLDLIIDLILADTNEMQTDDVPGLIDALNDLDSTAVQTASNAALVALKLDHLVAVAESDDPVDNSIIAKLAASDGDWSGFSAATDALEAIRDRGDAAWDTADVSGLATAAALGTTDGKVDAILLDTNELQTDDVPGLIAALNNLSSAQAQTAATAALNAYDPPTKTELDAAQSSIEGDIAALNNISTSDVNAQVLDVLNTDTFAEPTSVPASTASLVAKIGWLMKLARNRITQTATTQTVYDDDATTAAATSSVSDNGTTFERGEWS